MKFWVKDKMGIYQIKVSPKVKLIYVENKGLAVFASKDFKKGKKITALRGELVKKDKVSPLSIQFDEKYFIHDENFFWEDFFNHSCSPNAFLDVAKRGFYALKNIKNNEEITFNYLTTEYDLREQGCDFKCFCGSPNCFKKIDGFKYLSKKQQLKLKPYLSPYLSGKIK
jgi:hypothetical protein